MAAPAKAQRNDEIADLVATLAGRQQQRTTVVRPLKGPERAAVLMLALGESHGEKVWKLLDDDELRQLSVVMSLVLFNCGTAISGHSTGSLSH